MATRGDCTQSAIDVRRGRRRAANRRHRDDRGASAASAAGFAKRPSANPGEAWLSDQEWSPETLELAEARIGKPLIVVCPFTVTAQDRSYEDVSKRWVGRSPMWLALGEERLWFLYGRPQPSPDDAVAAAIARHAPAIGGVWEVLPRAGLVLHTLEHPEFDQLEMSWPEEFRLIAGELRGPGEQRRHLTGLLAGDQFGLGAQ